MFSLHCNDNENYLFVLANVKVLIILLLTYYLGWASRDFVNGEINEIIWPTHIDLNLDELHYYLFTVSLDRCDRSFDIADDLIIMCDETVNTSINFIYKKAAYKMNCHVPHTFSLVTVCLLFWRVIAWKID